MLVPETVLHLPYQQDVLLTCDRFSLTELIILDGVWLLFAPLVSELTYVIDSSRFAECSTHYVTERVDSLKVTLSMSQGAVGFLNAVLTMSKTEVDLLKKSDSLYVTERHRFAEYSTHYMIHSSRFAECSRHSVPILQIFYLGRSK